ncbi:DUF4192 domain-containing protein [Micromonospora sp. WMMD1082]|uniref:DUF4192 domain-containing protein n=1 Tax=Micromonospora sp. WMMD1082 TaxID=3016104 RepID=UPI002416766C|nr:DUF4192 domain-containing protein [Micromonospora sp. WMMD1082]MDG4793656.1 DUF4192 domain-containing protein [Micromonospora sp. WMMD1082]
MVSSSTLTVRSAADMVTAVPYLIGFHPGDGNLVVIVCAGGRVTFAARADLPDPDAAAAHIHELAGGLVPVVRRQQPMTAVVVIGYGDAAHVDPALRTVEEALTAAGLPVRELLRVTAGRFFSLTCDNPACCPPQGTPFDQTASVVAVQATVAGMVALPDRAAMAVRFAPVEGAARHGMRRATLAAASRLEALADAGSDAMHEACAAAVRDALGNHDGGRHLSDDEMAWLTLLLAHPVVRDFAAELTEPHERHVTVWAEVTRRAEEPFVPAPATLLALAAWRCGDGVLAAMALEYALHIDPDYTLAGLLLQALQAGLPPSVVQQAFSGQ